MFHPDQCVSNCSICYFSFCAVYHPYVHFYLCFYNVGPACDGFLCFSMMHCSVLSLPNHKASMSLPLSQMHRGSSFWQHQCLLSKGGYEQDSMKRMDVWCEDAGMFYLEVAFSSLPSSKGWTLYIQVCLSLLFCLFIAIKEWQWYLQCCSPCEMSTKAIQLLHWFAPDKKCQESIPCHQSFPL